MLHASQRHMSMLLKQLSTLSTLAWVYELNIIIHYSFLSLSNFIENHELLFLCCVAVEYSSCVHLL